MISEVARQVQNSTTKSRCRIEVVWGKSLPTLCIMLCAIVLLHEVVNAFHDSERDRQTNFPSRAQIEHQAQFFRHLNR
jgi:hypothetical protein